MISDEKSVSDDVFLAEAAAIHQSAKFEEAVAVYLAELVRWREGSPLMHKLGANKGRMHVTGYLLHLSAIDRLAGGEGGVTYGELFEICVARRAEVGARVLKTTLALLRLAGFVETWRGKTDRRVVHYRPTGRMYSHARLAYGYAAAALDVLEPQTRRLCRLQTDEVFLQTMLASAGAAHAEQPPGGYMPDFIGYIGEREGAGAVLALLIMTQARRAPPPSRAALASRFGLSKSQVTRILTDGAERGYYGLYENGQPVVTTKAEDSFRRWISIELAFHARHMR